MIIFAASTSYELIGWQQNEPQWRCLNVEGEIYIIVFSPTSPLHFPVYKEVSEEYL